MVQSIPTTVCNMPQRGAYHKFSQEIRNAVLEVAEAGGDWQSISETLHIPYRTAYGWLQRVDEPPRPRGGDRRSKLSPQQVDVILTWLEEDCQLTIAAIRDHIQDELGLIVSRQTVSRCLDGKLITYKKTHHFPHVINTLINKAKRQAYVGRALQAIAANKHLIFVDETNYNLFCRRTCGRAERGARAVVKLPNSKGPNLHIIGAISSNGLIHWERQRGSMKIPNFNLCLRHCLLSAFAAGLQSHNIVLVIDNAPSHAQAEQVIQEDAFHGVELLRLAPYSPILNPIEGVWSAVKARLKSSLQEGFLEIMAGDPAGVLTQCEFRLHFLERCVDLAMPHVTADLCARLCNHVQTHFQASIQMQDMPVGL